MGNTFDKFIIQVQIISQKTNYNFLDMTNEMINYVNLLPFDDFISILSEIGTIPERIEHDSTEEKLYSKATDIVLSRSFFELGLKSKVLSERANSADVLAKSIYHNYSLVGDAKAFRLSRTAKNQKDFKIKSMNDWRGDDNDYAVLVSPYNQYPNTTSQIYSQALTVNVCLLSWEHLYFLLSNNIKETEDCNLSFIWNISD
ncbi:MAG: HindIII family type II restriction endonuclease, partial [Candidatus Coproplasma sp.]